MQGRKQKVLGGANPKGKKFLRPLHLEVGRAHARTAKGGDAEGGVKDARPERALSGRGALAVAKLARMFGEALLTFAGEYAAAAVSGPDSTAAEVVDLVPEGRGQRQRQILDLPELGTERGMRTADIASAISYEVPNTHST